LRIIGGMVNKCSMFTKCVFRRQPTPTNHLSNKDAQDFLQKLSMALLADTTPQHAMEVIAESGKTPAVRNCARAVYADLHSGKTLGEALETSKSFDAFIVRGVQFGETTGRLIEMTHILLKALKADAAAAEEKAKETRSLGLAVLVGLVVGIVIGRATK